MDEGVQEKPKLLFRLLEGAFMAQFYVIKALSYVLPPSAIYLIPKAMGYAFFYARPGMRRRQARKMTDAMPHHTAPRELDRLGESSRVLMERIAFDDYDAIRILLQGISDIFSRHGDLNNVGAVVLASKTWTDDAGRQHPLVADAAAAQVVFPTTAGEAYFSRMQ
jgi:hypothetical protein